MHDGQRVERSGVAPLKQLIQHGRGSLKTVKRDFRLPRYPFRACSIHLPSACLPEPAVHAVLGEQFAVRAAFGNLSAGEHDDLLRAADGGEAVGDDDNGFVLHQRVDGLLHGDFAFGVERGGGFVQDDDGRVFQQGAGDADALFFAAGEFAADVAHAGLVAFGHRHDEVVAAGGAGGGFDFCVAGIGFAEADVVGDGVVKQVNVLEDDGNLPHQVFLGEGADVGAADEDAPLLRVGVAHDEADEGGFAAAAVPDQRGEGAFGDVQADAAQDGFGVGVVVVMHVFKCDAEQRVGQGFGEQGFALDGFHFAHRLLQARQAAAGAVGGFEHGQPLAVFQQFRVQARVCAGQTGAGAFGEGLRPLLDGHNQGKAEQQRQPEPVPQHRQQRGGQRRADGGNQHIADNQGVVVGFVYRARKQRVQLTAALAVQDLQRDAAQVFAHFAACRIARAGAVALVIIILRAPAEQGGEREQHGKQRQPKRCTTVFARAQRQKGRQQHGKPRALQQRGGDAVAQTAFEHPRLFAGGGENGAVNADGVHGKLLLGGGFRLPLGCSNGI